MIDRLDNQIIRLATWVAHGIQGWVGWSSFRIAAACNVGYMACLLMLILNYWMPLLNGTSGKPQATPAFLLIVSLVGLPIAAWRHTIFMSMAREWEAGDSDALPAMASGQRTHLIWRMLFLWLLGLDVVCYVLGMPYQHPFLEAYRNTMAFWLATTAYFLEVTPMRPGKTKVGEFVKALRAFGASPVKVQS